MDKTPRVRSVVFRGWTDSYEIKILTDKRSHKFSELNLNNNVEVCWFFINSKCQFRFRGSSSFDQGNDTLDHWNQIDDQSKIMWSWPTPGAISINNDENNLKIKSNSKISENFVLIKIKILHVDQLILQKPIHMRRQWSINKEWIEENSNA